MSIPLPAIRLGSARSRFSSRVATASPPLTAREICEKVARDIGIQRDEPSRPNLIDPAVLPTQRDELSRPSLIDPQEEPSRPSLVEPPVLTTQRGSLSRQSLIDPEVLPTQREELSRSSLIDPEVLTTQQDEPSRPNLVEPQALITQRDEPSLVDTEPEPIEALLPAHECYCYLPEPDELTVRIDQDDGEESDHSADDVLNQIEYHFNRMVEVTRGLKAEKTKRQETELTTIATNETNTCAGTQLLRINGVLYDPVSNTYFTNPIS